ncbi:RNA polymerase sigma factor [Bizionia sediminis]|uniref:RNA polymerase sigma factor n=1 Tax=Bizionia sediminis TaxID=1737064 RepID=A0ABW5KV10_9FLAO
MPSNKLEKSIVSFCKGKTTAIVPLYKTWSTELYFVAYKYLRNKEEAEDVVADVFEKLLNMPVAKRKEKFLDGKISIKALLLVAVKNKALDVIKVQTNRRRIEQNIQNTETLTAKNTVWLNLSNEFLESILNILPKRERDILKMNMDGYDRNEIGQALNVSPKTVSNSLSLSRNKLKEILDDF